MLDEQSLRMLTEEVFERAEWYGSVGPNSRVPELFALGWVAGARELSRSEVEQLRRALNAHLVHEDQKQTAATLIQSAIRNVN